MYLKVNITEANPCALIVQDLSLYLREDESDLQVFDLFKVSLRVGIDVVLKNTLEGTSVYEYSVSEGIEPVKIQTDFNGWVTIQHIVIPTYEWVKTRIDDDGFVMSDYDKIYFYNDKKFYKLVKDTITEVTIGELTLVNTYHTTISKFAKDFVFICKFLQCYLDICKLLMEAGCLKDCENKSKLGDLIFKRDWVWMTMNVINYLIEFNQFEEAQRIIENVGGCNGICEPDAAQTKKPGGCGCGA